MGWHEGELVNFDFAPYGIVVNIDMDKVER
jgi:hypothetical protein